MAKLTDFELEAERKYAEKLAAREKKFEEREKERQRKYYIIAMCLFHVTKSNWSRFQP